MKNTIEIGIFEILIIAVLLAFSVGVTVGAMVTERLSWKQIPVGIEVQNER